jgi:hypothetical protein
MHILLLAALQVLRAARSHYLVLLDVQEPEHV